MVEVWGRKNAYNVQKVLWTLQELEVDYKHYHIGSDSGDLDTDSFLLKNPHARIPVIKDKNEYIWESNTIIRYLSSQYGKESLWIDNPLTRTQADRWMDWELATLQPDFIALFWSYYRTPEKHRDLSKITTVKKRCESHFNKLDHHLKQQPYIAGSAFTMGDIPCATGLYRYFTMGLSIACPKHLLAWYARLQQRDAFRQCIMVPYQDLKGRVRF
jgi:glutathione S-transferase